MDALDILRDRLVGSFITRISVGDSFDLLSSFGFWLIAQNVSSPREEQFNEYLLSNYPIVKNEVDTGNTAKSIVMTALMRQQILNVDLDSDAALSLEFSGGETLMLPTDVDIVDWQWALCKQNSNPYKEFMVGCFWKGEMQISDSYNSL